MTGMDRRTLLALGLGTIALGAVGCTPVAAGPVSPSGGSPATGSSPFASGSSTPSPSPATFNGWLQTRQAPYLIAHRGAGTTVPEHSIPGYLRALEWGAQAMELSVVMSSDGVLYCHHDLTLDRTTTLTGQTSATASAVFDTGRIEIPRLGPRWNGSGMPPIPRFEAALDAIGDRAVLCLEAKDDRAYEPMMQIVSQRKLGGQVIVKSHYPSSRIRQAKSAGFPVFAYIGSTLDTSRDSITALARLLDPHIDALALPLRDDLGMFIDDTLVKIAVATGVPVWLFPVNRRSEVQYWSDLGVAGFVTPALGYVAGTVPVVTRDTFGTGELAPGLTTKDPYNDGYAVGWDTPGAIQITENLSRYICLGDLSPVANSDASYRAQAEVAWVSGPMKDTEAFVLGFGCLDDSYLATARSGYQVQLQRSGRLSLHRVEPDGSLHQLGAEVHAQSLQLSTWRKLEVEVSASTIVVRQGPSAVLKVDDAAWRGGYLHVGRTDGFGFLAVRNIKVGT